MFHLFREDGFFGLGGWGREPSPISDDDDRGLIHAIVEGFLMALCLWIFFQVTASAEEWGNRTYLKEEFREDLKQAIVNEGWYCGFVHGRAEIRKDHLGNTIVKIECDSKVFYRLTITEADQTFLAPW